LIQDFRKPFSGYNFDTKANPRNPNVPVDQH
jgi:hypothetical protein